MKKLIALVGLLCLMAGSAGAYVTDAPHNETNDVSCGDCHTYSLWWQYSPAEQDISKGYAAITDEICNSCHDNKPGFPSKIGHTGISIHGPDTLDDWSTACVDCHDPHNQAQLDWISEDPALADRLFLVTGRVSGDAVVGDNTTITFDPLSINYNDDSNWTVMTDPPPVPNSPLVLTWETKNRFSQRGLIFVHDTAERINTYSIISVDSTNKKIVLRGAPDTPIDDNATFGLIYGQLIKQQIETPYSGARDVKFFDPKVTYSSGGFVDDNSTPPVEGICQVCHTDTKYWLNDGTIVDSIAAPGVSDHNTNTPCNDCHDTNLGFKPGFLPHPWLVSTATTCANCHLSDEDGVVNEHANGDCKRCHTTEPLLISSISGRSLGNWPTNDRPLNDGTCYDCHNGNFPGVRDITGDFTNHLRALDDDNNTTNGLNGHVDQVAADTNCTTFCHFHRNKDLITQIHTGADPSTPIDPCIKCHDLSIKTEGAITYNGTYDGNNTLLSKGRYTGSGVLRRSATTGVSDCSDCHAAIEEDFENHKNRNTHVGQVYASDTKCTRCHSGDVIKMVHKWDCGKCHDGLLNGGLKSLAATHGPGDCKNCHGSSFYLHDITKFVNFDHDDDGVVAAEPLGSDPDCMACHNEGSAGLDLIFKIHEPLDQEQKNTFTYQDHCAYCHDPDGYLIGSATNHGLSDDGFGDPNTCSTCHVYEGDKNNDHPTHVGSGSNNTMNGYILATDRCVSCHIGDRMKVVHDKKCLYCHESTFRQGGAKLLSSLPDPDLYGDKDGHLNCIECHQSLGLSFMAGMDNIPAQKDHWKASDHTNQVVAVPGCITCHPGNLQTEVHNACSSCHAKFPGSNLYSGVLIGSASGRGIGQAPAAPLNDCYTCHGDFTLHNDDELVAPIERKHNFEIILTPSCGIAGCHTEIDFDPDGTTVLGLHNVQGCTTCHTASGEMKGSALNSASLSNTIWGPITIYGGQCTACHTSYFDGHTHGTNGLHYVSQGADKSSGMSCSTANCHVVGNWVEIRAEHDVNNDGNYCATCHESSRANSVNPTYGDVPGVIFAGSSTNLITCLDCHTNTATYGSASNPHPAP